MRRAYRTGLFMPLILGVGGCGSPQWGTRKLTESCPVEFRVRDTSGNPLSAGRAVVTLFGPHSSTYEPRMVDGLTSSEGRVRWDRLPPGEYDFEVRARGLVTAGEIARDGRGFHVDIRNCPPPREVAMSRGAIVRVQVECEHSSCDDVEVGIDSGEADHLPNPFQLGRTDSQGLVVLHGIRPGRATVSARKNRGRPGELVGDVKEIELNDGKETDVAIKMRSKGGPAAVTGSVSDSSGAPVYAGVEINCGDIRRMAVTKRDGRFELRDLPAGTCELDVHKDFKKKILRVEAPADVRVTLDP
jgi:hypothetical protein